MKKIIFIIFLFFLVLFQQLFIPFFLHFYLSLFFILFFTLHFLEIKRDYILISIFEGGILLDIFSTSCMFSHLISLFLLSLILEKILRKINKEHILWFSLIFPLSFLLYILFINIFDSLGNFLILNFIPKLSIKEFLLNFLLAISFFSLAKKYERNLY